MSNSPIKRYELTWGDRPLIIEFNRLAGQANGACTVQYGETMVLVTAVMSDSIRPDIDYFPLMVEYKENLYAAGKISGSRFVKREGRPTDQSVLSGRIIDRSVRPLFTAAIRNDIQVVVTVLSYEEDSDPDIAGLIGAAASLMVSDIPWYGPLAGCIVAAKAGQYYLNPKADLADTAEINIFVAGRTMETVMLEADGHEATEQATLGAIEFGLRQLEPVVTLLKKIQAEIGKAKMTIVKPDPVVVEIDKVKDFYSSHHDSLFGSGNKRQRHQRHEEVVLALKTALPDEANHEYAVEQFEKLFHQEMIERIFTQGKRVDDRAVDEIRPLLVDVGLVPRVHGSGLFQRGDTQVLSIATLSSPNSEQVFDTMRLDEKRHYFHHYNFPSFSVGEAQPMRGPGRREIGHGALAEKALVPMLPERSTFPYTIRIVSEVLSSNGSSSQGSICGSSLALMDAGVPIKRPVAGIAMGIAFRQPDSKSDYRLLTDVQDVEDDERSMDFKVAGTTVGITAIQLDIKFDGLTLQMIQDTLTQAKSARLKLLQQMQAVIAEPRKELSHHAPRIETIQIDKEKIGELIGPGGKVINGIIDQTGVEIDIQEDGLVYVTATKPAAMQQALVLIRDIVREIAIGEVYTGTVVKIVIDRNNPSKQIGAIVELTASQDGMIHISQIANERIDKVTDVLKEGDQVRVKVIDIDKEKGRISLSRKVLL